MSKVIIDLSEYTNWLKSEISETVEYIVNKQSRKNNISFDEAKRDLLQQLKLAEIPQTYILAIEKCIQEKNVELYSSIINQLVIDKFEYPLFKFDLLEKMQDFEIQLSRLSDGSDSDGNDDDDSDLSDDSADKLISKYMNDYQYLIDKTSENMNVIKGKIEDIISQLGDEWNGSVVTIVPSGLGKRYEEYSDQDSAAIYVGNVDNYCMFSYFVLDKIVIDDILEGGYDDDDSFESNEQKMDYFNLVSGLQNPNSINKNKVITLYTARPTKDRELYLNSKQVPNNIFLTNMLSSAEGLAIDLAGSDNARRDVWKVRINKKYLIETLNTRIEKQYQVIGKNSTVPVEHLELIIPSQ